MRGLAGYQHCWLLLPEGEGPYKEHSTLYKESLSFDCCYLKVGGIVQLLLLLLLPPCPLPPQQPHAIPLSCLPICSTAPASLSMLARPLRAR